MKQKELLSTSSLLRLLTALLLLIALTDQNIGYYDFLRWVVTAVSIYISVLSYKQNLQIGSWLFGIIALLFNPLFPFYLGKDTWQIVDLIVAVIFVVSIKSVNENKVLNNT